eukprot:CAMPEP_0183770660 /NCGR_PEP_ID=MMETSP0739-20130205/29512_1 /TAXON_ID=385413 /ORGANISM="Thalassiosira miniscula, Strain CCMP1093" /LENGTH=59 /DNA_ID=CAMNT_0026010767 /DNA_START=15 /DNA_END=190 /DNA_ORIENTATION=+
MTKRGESTATFGYHECHDVVNEELRASVLETMETMKEKQDQFGEYNFALGIAAARTVLS